MSKSGFSIGILAFVGGAALVACGSDGAEGNGNDVLEGKVPAATVKSITLSINSMNQSDIEAGTISKDENISQGSANPWGDFVDEATRACGTDPAAFEISEAAITLDTAGSDRVDKLDDVVSDRATAYFISTQGSDEEATMVDIGSIDAPSGPGPVSLTLADTRSTLAVLHERLVGGDFHVGLRASTQMTDKDDFSMDIRLSLGAHAYCK